MITGLDYLLFTGEITTDAEWLMITLGLGDVAILRVTSAELLLSKDNKTRTYSKAWIYSLAGYVAE